MINIETDFWSANEAFEYLYKKISKHGGNFAGTKALFNVGFTLLEPRARMITSDMRNWKEDYAEAEWKWYLSENRNISKLGDIYGKVPEIWKRMADGNGDVNSNYGWQWSRNDQIDYVVDLLKNEPDTRQAAITILDTKEHDTFTFDTPCTYAIQFTIVNNKLHMCVTMRSNDLWYGFCNDQYQFSNMQDMISLELGIKPGTYYHFAHNMHLYNDKI